MPHTAKIQTKRARQHDAERTGQRILSVLEREAKRRLSALFKQLPIGSRHEVQGLLRRVAQLEQRLTRTDQSVDYELGHSMNASTIPGPLTQETSLRRYTELSWDEV